MKPTSLLLALIPVTLAAPIADAGAVTAADKRAYGDYGSYPPPAGGYGSYGTYGATPATYASYPPPAGGYGSYGTYKRAVSNFFKKVLG